MQNDKISSKGSGLKVNPNVKKFYSKLEEIRVRRRLEEKQAFPSSKRYTQDHLCLYGYSSFKAMQSGKIKNPPSYHEIELLSKYLELGPLEYYELLSAAHYYQHTPILAADERDNLLDYTRQQIHQFSHCPALILDSNWDVLDINNALLKLLSRLHFTIERKKVNLLKMIFQVGAEWWDKVLSEPDGWEQLAKQSIIDFRFTNRHLNNEELYLSLWDELKEYPDFLRIWEITSYDKQTNRLDFNFGVKLMSGENITLNRLFLTVGDYDYPRIVQFTPVDNLTQNLFRQAGFVIIP